QTSARYVELLAEQHGDPLADRLDAPQRLLEDVERSRLHVPSLDLRDGDLEPGRAAKDPGPEPAPSLVPAERGGVVVAGLELLGTAEHPHAFDPAGRQSTQAVGMRVEASAHRLDVVGEDLLLERGEQAARLE